MPKYNFPDKNNKGGDLAVNMANAALEKVSALATNKGVDCLGPELGPELDQIIGEIDVPEALGHLYGLCRDRSANAYRRDDERRPTIYYDAAETIIFKLGSMKSERSVRVLISILSDSERPIDGALALSVGHAISMHGTIAIEHLERIRISGESTLRSFSEDLIKAIMVGELYGP